MFEREIRPHLPEIRMREIGVGFDRLDLDRVLDEYKQRDLKPCEEKSAWQNVKFQVSIGTQKRDMAASTSASTELGAFENALRRVRGKKPKASTIRR